MLLQALSFSYKKRFWCRDFGHFFQLAYRYFWSFLPRISSDPIAISSVARWDYFPSASHLKVHSRLFILTVCDHCLSDKQTLIWYFSTLNAFKRSVVPINFSLFLKCVRTSFICTFLGQLLVVSVSLLSRSICFVVHVTLSCFWANKLVMMIFYFWSPSITPKLMELGNWNLIHWVGTGSHQLGPGSDRWDLSSAVGT